MFENLRAGLKKPPTKIHQHLKTQIDPAQPKDFATYSKNLPVYRFVDLFRAVEYFFEQTGARVTKLESSHPHFGLSDLIQGIFFDRRDQQIKPSDRNAQPVGFDEEIFLPVDTFWTSTKGEEKLVVRLWENTFQATTTLEVSCNISVRAEEVLEQVIARSEAHSVYRNSILRLSFEAGTRDEYGDVEKPESLRIVFLGDRPVTSEDLILDQEVSDVIKRNVIDLFTRRDVLKSGSVPTKRGVLLYGPPGTGKTFTCRHICNQIADATRIFVTGQALNNIGAIFSVARMYQPSLVFLEDVDLAFSSREINLFNSGLADLLDQLDGVAPDDDVSVVMTTNSIERMENAIKDRPGRVSQCIFMDAPGAELRKRYLQRYLETFDATKLDMDMLSEISDGVSQAFLKEWIYRAAQMATERDNYCGGCVKLRDSDFKRAMREMKGGLDGAGAKIIGFTTS